SLLWRCAGEVEPDVIAVFGDCDANTNLSAGRPLGIEFLDSMENSVRKLAEPRPEASFSRAQDEVDTGFDSCVPVLPRELKEPLAPFQDRSDLCPKIAGALIGRPGV